MKTLTLHLEEEVVQDIELSLRNKRLDGKFGGVIDMLGLAVFETIKANQTERTLRYRRKAKIINAIGQ